MKQYGKLVDKLLQSNQPSVQYKIRVGVMGEDSTSPAVIALRNEIKESAVVKTLLAEQTPDGTIPCDPYEKWRGAHWVLTTLAELDYPPNDPQLYPLREQVCNWIFSPEIKVKQTRLINKLYRRHASQEGNLIYYLCKLGLADKRVDQVAADLLTYQWPDGGWNCDKNPLAKKSTFIHSSIALRGLIYYTQIVPSQKIKAAIRIAAELFLKRSLFLRLSTGKPIKDSFVKLTYPDYHFYTYLMGLKIMSEGGMINDKRCQPALDLLESKFIPNKGFSVEKKYYQHNTNKKQRFSPVHWADFKLGRANMFLTADALVVLKKSGRLQV